MSGPSQPHHSLTSDDITTVLFDDGSDSDSDSVDGGSARAESETNHAWDEFKPAVEEKDNTETVKVAALNTDAQ